MKQQQYLFLFQFVCWLISELPTGFSWQSLVYLDLGSNLLEGPLPSSLCNSTNMEILVLANNKLSGTIPECLGNFSSGLTALDLRHNSFHGTIPTYFSKDIKLKNLGLNGNRLEGPLPQSLKNCKSLEVLDVGNNNIRDTFPMWLGSLPQLHVLILRSNRFNGTIGTSKLPFSKLRIVDLAYNDFTGSLPAELLKKLPAMMTADDGKNVLKYMGEGDGSYYLDSVSLVWKGMDVEIKRVLSILTTIDLSGNRFEGEVPESIGNLHALKLLNLSHNYFSGHIPADLGNLNSLESLDLSSNQFTGQIPMQLTKLTALSKFNVSQNRLEGPIPNVNQFGTFPNDSYYGNAGLCGFPLDTCKNGRQSPSATTIFWETDCLDLQSGFTWKSVVLGYGFGMIIGLFSGGLMIFTAKPKWLLEIVEQTFKQIGLKTNKRRYIIIMA